jgi:hypothetical protein
MGMRARFNPGNNVPARASAALVAGTFVKVSADKDSDGNYQVATCGLGERCLGVTEEDVTTAQLSQSAHSVEQLVNVVRKCIARVVPGASITAGQAIQSDSQGRAIPLASAVAAAVNTGVVGSNNAITWAARVAGAAGNAITVAITNPGGTAAAEVVTVAAGAVSVAARTSSGSITSTAAEIIAAIQQHGEASELVTVANDSTSTGAGTVAAVSATNLAGGTDPEGGGHVNGYAVADAASDDDFAEIELS